MSDKNEFKKMHINITVLEDENNKDYVRTTVQSDVPTPEGEVDPINPNHKTIFLMLYAAVLNLTAIRNREIADDAVKKMIRILSEAEDKDFEQYAEEHKNEIRAPEKDS